jgi:hypothetical protein
MTLTKTPLEPYTLLSVIESWEPPIYPHCSDCLHARVGGSPEQSSATCAMGHGGTIDLWRLIRRSSPRGFRSAAKCPDFSSMDDEEAIS